MNDYTQTIQPTILRQTIKVTMSQRGPQGASFIWRDGWLTATSYNANDVVSHGGNLYISILAHTSGASSEPGVGASWETYWELMIESSSGGGAWGTITGTLSNQTDLQTALDAKVPTTRTVNGQALSANVTLTTADIADSLNRRYVTDAQLVVIGNTSGTNTGDQTLASYGITSTVAELNFTDGVTSSIQTQLNARQPLDAQLTDIAGLTPSDNGVIIGNGTNFVLESGATLRTSLGLAIGSDVQAFDALLDDIADLADPGADRILFWDDSAGIVTWLTAGTGLSITGTTLNASGTPQTPWESNIDGGGFDLSNVELITADFIEVTEVRSDFITAGAGSMTLEAGGMNFASADGQYQFDQGTGIQGLVDFTALTQGRTFEFPDEDGTVALLSDIPASGANTALSNLSAVAINTTLLPGSNDGAGLGSATLSFSDLFLASGAVLNFANSNVVVTHSSGILTVGTGDLRITTAGTNTASVVTVGGAQTLTAKTYQLTASPASDTTANGMTAQFLANENQAFGDAIYIASDGDAQLGDADAEATSRIIGMCIATVTAGNTGTYLLRGFARNDAWAWTVGGFVYLSTTGTTGNTLTQTAPSGTDDAIVIVGVATHADRMYVNPQLVIVEHT